MMFYDGDSDIEKILIKPKPITPIIQTPVLTPVLVKTQQNEDNILGVRPKSKTKLEMVPIET